MYFIVQIVAIKSNIVWCKYKATTELVSSLCESEKDNKGEGAKVGLQLLLSSWYLRLATGSV